MDLSPPLSGPDRASLRRLWTYLWPGQRARLGGLALVNLVIAGVTTLYPLVIDRAFSLFAARDPAIVWQVPLAVLAIVTVKGGAWYAQSVLTQSIALRAAQRMQEAMFAKLAHADLARMEREPPAALAAHFTSDTLVMRDGIARVLNAQADVLTIIGLVATMIHLDWVMSLVALLVYPLAIAPLEKIGRRIRKASYNLQDITAATAARLTEIFAQIRVVQTYRLEATMSARAETAFDDLYRANARVVRRRNRAEPIMEVLGGAAVAGIIGFAGYRSAIGTGSLGAFTGFVTALLIAAGPARALGTLSAAVNQGKAALSRIVTVLDEAPRILPGTSNALPAQAGLSVEFRDVRLAYADGRAGLAGLSLTIPAGSTAGLAGASGSGKTTALSLIPRFYDANAGQVLIGGHDVRDFSLTALRDMIAWVGQDSILFDETIAENVARGRPGAAPAEIEAALRAAAAWDFVQSLPQGLQTRAGTSGRLLSGGQRQRIALARAIIKDAPILLLDEATSALDAESEAAIHAALIAQQHRRTIIMTAHRLATIRHADLIAVLDQGSVIETGTHTSLLASNGAYARLAAAQG